MRQPAFPVLYLVELKTVGTPSASLESMFGKFDPAKGRWKKQKHLADMAKAAQRPGIAALVVINFRARGVTYAMPAEAVLDFMRLTLDGGRRSIPPAWCAEHGVLVGQRQLRVNWRYDVAGMMDKTPVLPGSQKRLHQTPMDEIEERRMPSEKKNCSHLRDLR